MVKAELIKRSPLRILEKSSHGGVGPGNVGVIASARGVGKTACLVHIATDQLFQGKHVIHVSFSQRTDHIVSWYEGIFQEIAKEKKLTDGTEIHDELIKNRVIMNFNQAGVSIDQLKRSLTALIGDGHFKAEVIVIDGYDFRSGSVDFIKGLTSFAGDHKVALWFTADVESDKVDSRGVPEVLKAYADIITILISLKNTEGNIGLELVKDHDRYVDEELPLKLDPRTMLIDDGKN